MDNMSFYLLWVVIVLMCVNNWILWGFVTRIQDRLSSLERVTPSWGTATAGHIKGANDG